MFSKEFGASLLRSTWNLSAPGLEAVGQERRPLIAILRRIWDFIPYIGDVWVPFVFHFDFVDDATGAWCWSASGRRPSATATASPCPTRAWTSASRRRMAVALDALQSR